MVCFVEFNGLLMGFEWIFDDGPMNFHGESCEIMGR